MITTPLPEKKTRKKEEKNEEKNSNLRRQSSRRPASSLPVLSHVLRTSSLFFRRNIACPILSMESGGPPMTTMSMSLFGNTKPVVASAVQPREEVVASAGGASISSSRETGQNENITGRGRFGGVPGFHRRLGLLFCARHCCSDTSAISNSRREKKSWSQFLGHPKTVEALLIMGRSRREHLLSHKTSEKRPSRKAKSTYDCNCLCPTKNLFFPGRLPVEIARWCHTHCPKLFRQRQFRAPNQHHQPIRVTPAGRLFQGAESPQPPDQIYPHGVPVVALTTVSGCNNKICCCSVFAAF